MITGYSNIISVTTLPGLLLDVYPSAAAAYSVRKLRTAYTGSAIRVRRTDLTEQNIGFTSTGNLDTAALISFVGTGALDNGFVTTWYDQSGNGRDATQTTAIQQPQIVSAGVILLAGTKPSIFNSNSNSNGLNLSSISATNFTILYAAKKSSTATSQSILLTSTSVMQIGDNVDGGGNPIGYFNADSIGFSKNNTTKTGVAATTYHLAYLNRKDTNNAVGQFNNSTNSYATGTTNAAVISNIAGFGSNFSYVGFFQEIIIYSTDLSANQSGLQNNINTYYGIY